MPFIVLIGFVLALNTSVANAVSIETLLQAAGISAVPQPVAAALGVVPVAGLHQVWQVPWRIDPVNRWRLWGAVLAGGVVGPVLLLAGLRIASAASVSLWLNLELVATAVLGHGFFRDHLTRYGWPWRLA